MPSDSDEEERRERERKEEEERAESIREALKRTVVCAVVGDAQSGKSALITRFKEDNFDFITRAATDFWMQPLSYRIGFEEVNLELKEIKGK